jgi:GTPase KRas protein
MTLQSLVESYDPTVWDSYRKQVVIDGQTCMLEVLDTGGEEEYGALRDQWIRDGEGFVLVYSITKRRSFERISKFHNQIQRVKEESASSLPYPGSPFSRQHYNLAKMPPIMLVGNNSDRITEREISTEEGYDLARKLGCDFVEASAKNDLARKLGCYFVEASAKNSINVEKAFYDVVRKLRREDIEARMQLLVASKEITQGHHAPRQYRRPQKKVGGVSQVWQRVRARAN